ncbi:tripartite tricarboxylate transporter permease [Candidatus Persebacteraceae bacterium Df01]|uniref:Tripartite tricarboxylate transporter permease n=1 Tax=Candidatus Doriopsillibacter californiensis TaxID=2970740 RepID=A0ABT7QJY9_9GAMM|nr:tripartite tricarboxylate transporter permease [Candidatus Persebacteraceae bacterium Df01]
MPEFLNYLGNVFAPFNFSILLLGTAGGLILGALPGLSPTMAVALLIPFTFHMEPTSGLILLGSVYTATVAGGAVSAILLKIPGAPANIATTLDGHQMARQGRAAQALQLSFLSSGVGGVLGVLVLIFFTPVLARWALNFGPSHLFWLAVLGVTVIASLATNSMIKGLAAGCIGLWISSIGYDGVHGVHRFSFTSHLDGGIHIIAALVGLFAIPQVIDMLVRSRGGGSGENMSKTVQPHSLLQAVRQVLSKPRTLTIGSIVGIVVGLVPGAGGQIAGLVAYDQSRKFSKTRETYGKGEPEGLIAAETANNAMVGPSLVPLLTLSVPGSPTAAVLLGGLLIHGIFPGPSLFTDYPEVSWTFINSLLVGQVLMVVLGLALARLAAKVIMLPEHYLAAAVVVLAVFGTYSVQHSYSDVLIMATLGGGMWFFEKYGFSAAPLVLGIVLGPIAEQNFVYGRTIAEAGDGILPYFFGGGLNIALVTLIILSVLGSAVLEMRARRKSSLVVA